MKKVIFIGGLGRENEFGGELTKNKFIVRQLRNLGWNVVTVDTAGARRNPFKILSMPFKVAASPNVPIIFSTCFANIRPFFKIISRLWPRRKYVYWVIGGNLYKRITEGPYNVDDFDRFAAILVEGKKMLSELNELGIDGIRVVPNFKDVSLIPDISEKHIGSDDVLRCVFFSRITPSKGVNIILETCRNLRDSGLNFTVDFYGEVATDYRDEFLSEIAKFENVSYKGVLDFFAPDGYQTLARYHLTLFPTYWEGEGFPGVIVDSYIAGVPVLASDWNFNGELIDSETGFLCKANDQGDFERIFRDILIHRDSLDKHFSQCQIKASCFDYKKVVSENLINEILK